MVDNKTITTIKTKHFTPCAAEAQRWSSDFLTQKKISTLE